MSPTSARLPVAVTAMCLVGLAALVYAPHVVNGSFVSDDWANADCYRNCADPGYATSVTSFHYSFGARPLLAVLLPLPYVVFGTANPAWHLVLALAVAVLTSLCLFWFLRAAGLRWRHAAVVAAIDLLFPWDSATRLWPSVAMNDVATCLVLLGAVAALCGLERRGTPALLWHALALALFVMSVMVYEAPGPLVLVLGLLYLVRSGWRRALPRWTADVLAVGAALAYSATHTVKHRSSLGEAIDWAPRVVRGLADRVIRTAIPVGGGGTLLVALGAVLAAGVVGAVLIGRRLPVDDPDRASLRRWLWVALSAAIATGAGSLLMVLSVSFEPSSPGLYNRGNIAIAGPIALLAWALVMLCATLVARALRDSAPLAAGVVPTLAAALVLTGLAVQARQDADRWDSASAEARRVLARIGGLPTLPPDTTIYTFGHAAQSAPGIPVFFDTWDLNGAARLALGDPSLRAYPAYRGARFSCLASGVATTLPAPTGLLSAPGSREPAGVPDWGPDRGGRYGHTLFLDVPSGRWAMIRDRRQCARAARDFVPGPMQLGEA